MAMNFTLTPKQVFEILPKIFKLSNEIIVNRLMKEKTTLVDSDARPTSVWHLLPGIYEIVFEGFIYVPQDYTTEIVTSPDLIRNGISMESVPYAPGYSGNVKVTLTVNGGPFEFNNTAVFGYLKHINNGVDRKVHYIDIPADMTSEQVDKKIMNIKDTFVQHQKTGNPFLDNVANLEAVDKTIERPVVVKEKKVSTLAGKVWVYKTDSAGEISHKLRVTLDELQEYLDKGYIKGFPPSMNHKNKPELLLENN